MKSKIRNLAKFNAEEIIQIRRHMHMYPELSFQEKLTGAFILSTLKNWGVKCEGGWAEHGIVGVIEGLKEGSKTIALRADIDALPILETNDVKYVSKHAGVMHACGHDVHSASLLGAIKILHEIRSEFGGQIKFIFQPGEEKLPGGASILIEEGVLQKPKVDKIFGQHVHPPLEVGKVGFRSGKYMASADEIYISVKGKGGHAALPHNVIDPVVMASQIIIQLQQIISRSCNPIIPSVLSFGKINSVGGATNIIPDEVRIEGTFRTMNEEWRDRAHQLMISQAEGIAKSMGGSCSFEVRKGYPFLHNHEGLTKMAMKYAVEYLGEENVVELDQRMSAEDFAYYSQHVPACFYRLGTGNKAKGITAPVHTSNFNVDEKALELGSGLMAYLALKELENI